MSSSQNKNTFHQKISEKSFFKINWSSLVMKNADKPSYS
ncbi:hypothetical protein RV07_GL002285 [Enterococcus malodoratus]|nr:hypothetical protein RV07_GL002285 [Enterococcus malodoratus]